jgi:hypothetical protein
VRMRVCAHGFSVRPAGKAGGHPRQFHLNRPAMARANSAGVIFLGAT